jgi:hypothetical protein
VVGRLVILEQCSPWIGQTTDSARRSVKFIVASRTLEHVTNGPSSGRFSASEERVRHSCLPEAHSKAIETARRTVRGKAGRREGASSILEWKQGGGGKAGFARIDFLRAGRGGCGDGGK